MSTVWRSTHLNARTGGVNSLPPSGTEELLVPIAKKGPMLEGGLLVEKQVKVLKYSKLEVE